MTVALPTDISQSENDGNPTSGPANQRSRCGIELSAQNNDRNGVYDGHSRVMLRYTSRSSVIDPIGHSAVYLSIINPGESSSVVLHVALHPNNRIIESRTLR